MNLIVVSRLTCNEGLYFRFITMVAKHDVGYEDILIECDKKDIDYYYGLLKAKGWFDFVDDFVIPDDREEGVRIDTELNYPLTVQTSHIKCENVTNLLGQIKNLAK